MALVPDPSSRIQVRSAGELKHPGQCVVCGSGDTERTYVDLDVFFDYEGMVYLCNICTTQVGESIGMFTPDEVSQAQTQIEELLATVETLTKEKNDAVEYATSLDRVLTSPLRTGVDTTNLVSSEPGPASDPAKAAVSGESEVEKPVESVNGPSTTGKSKLRNPAFQ
jgi:hypothetical protein